MHVPNGKTTALWSGWRILVTILIIGFVVEICAMFLLPVLLPPDTHPWIEPLIDATLLSIGNLPLLWFLLIRPMYADMRKSSYQTQLTMAALDEHAFVTITDVKGRITHANDSFCRISKFTLEELVGRDHRIVNSGHHPKSFMKNLWDTIKRGDPWHGELCNRAKDGSLYWLGATIVPFKDQAGQITQYVAIRQDITDRKEQEEVLRKSEERYRLTLDAHSDGEWDWNIATGEVRYGDRWLESLGYKRHEVPSHVCFWESIVHPDDLPRLRKKLNAHLDGRTPGYECENRLRMKSGEYRWNLDRGRVIERDTVGKPIRMVGTDTDISERKQKEDELRHAKLAAETADLAKSEFLANMSHEIRTPMTAILGFTDTLREEGEITLTPKQRVEAINTVHRNGEYLMGIIDDILDLSKIESGKATVERIAFKPCEIIAEVAELVRIRADAKGLVFNIEYIGAVPETIVNDPTRLRQILINLIGNAIKFTEEGAVRLIIRFVGEEKNDRDGSPMKAYMQFDVLDTGLGMSDEKTAILFQPFTQADTSTTRKFGGTGLGLTISKRFAELLGGDISVIDSEVGVGTRFRATVATGSLDGVKMLEDPLSATVVDEDTKVVVKAPQSDLHGIRVLLAEDGPDNQRLISFILKKAGADVTVEENGKLALDKALAATNGRRDGDPKRPFDLILMDMQMPVMDGYEATGQLRRKGYTGPIIALTAHAMAGDREKCLSAGCDDYATKPVDRQKLIELILEHVQNHRLNPDTNQTETPERLSLQGFRILLAEDNPSNQLLIVGILKNAGAEITAVKDGSLALDAALAARDNGNPFDIILMDIQMPVMGGDEATKMLREKAYTGPIIALTAYAMEGDRQKYLKAGFDNYATKPINRAKLIETIQTHFRPRGSQVPSDDNMQESLLMTLPTTT